MSDRNEQATDTERDALMCPMGCGVELDPMGLFAPYRTCPLCGTGYWRPKETPYYWGQGNEPSPEQHRFWGGRDAQWRATVGVGGGRLLDVGAGFGHFVRWANDHGWDAWGLDTDPWALERAVAPGRVVSDADSLAKDFDLVTMWDVLEHQVEPIPFLRTWLDCLSPGGRILVGSPNFASMKLRWPLLRRDPVRFNSVIRPDEHTLQMTERGIVLALERAGYKDVEILQPPPSHHPNPIVTWAIGRFPSLRQGLFATGRVPASDST